MPKFPIITHEYAAPRRADDGDAFGPVRAVPIEIRTGYHVSANDEPANPTHMVAIWLIANVPLAIIAWSIGALNGLQLASTALLFGLFVLLATVAVLLLVSGKWSITVAARSFHKTERYRVDAEERVRLAEIEAEKETERIRVEAMRLTAQYNAQLQIHARQEISAQIEAHGAQSTMNQVAGYVAPSTEPEPFVDDLRSELLRYLVRLYDLDDEGKPRMDKSGRIIKQVLWSARGDLNERDQKRVLTMFADGRQMVGTWIVRQAENKHWYVNIEKFTTPTKLARVFNWVHTPA